MVLKPSPEDCTPLSRKKIYLSAKKRRDGVCDQKPAWGSLESSPQLSHPWVTGKVFITIEQVSVQTQDSPLFLPFEEVQQDLKSQQEPVGMVSQEPAVSTVIGWPSRNYYRRVG